jgi:CubicO group peptidase (beta-lactamase class C family)
MQEGALIVLAASAFCAVATGSTAATERSEAQELELAVRSHAELDLFSGVVLVARNGKTIYAGAFGVADKDHRVPNSLETRFNVGSIGKSFTATLIMQLVEQGSLALNDPLGKHVPAFPFPEKDEITIHHLLSHTSGLGNYWMHPDFAAKASELRRVDDWLPFIYDEKPSTAPGEAFRYSNSGVVVLGAIIERVCAKPYPQVLRERILDPLGMRETGIVYADQVVPNRSTGYSRQADGTYLSNVFREPPAGPDGGLYATAGDLLRFDQGLHGEALLSEASKETMFTPAPNADGYACGWGTGTQHGKRFVGHTGGTTGVEAVFRRYLDDGLTVIVLSNYHKGASPIFASIDALLHAEPHALPSRDDPR